MSKRPPKPLKPASLRSNTLHRSSENTNLNGEKQSSLLRVPNFQLRNAVSNPEISIVSPGQESKGDRIARELIETEVSFLEDLKVLKELFFDNQDFAGDRKLLFTGLEAVIDVSIGLIQDLKMGLNLADVFLSKMNQISESYCQYCKSNEQALQRIKEYNNPSHPLHQPLIQTQLLMKGRTNAWDLSSMLVKPVQRVLKYPLLLKRLYEADPSPGLQKALEEINQVAELINEVKKRKDVVEKFAVKTNKNIVHGFNKKITRQAQKLINALEGDACEDDSTFDDLFRDFEGAKDMLIGLDKSISGWVQTVKTHLTLEQALSLSLENVYSQDRTGVHADIQKLVLEYRKSKQVCIDSIFKTLEARTKVTQKIITKGLETCVPVTKIIRKRNDKQLDYERLKSITAKGETPDPGLVESGDEYLSMNTLIIEEIPKLISCIGELVNVVMDDLISSQKEFCKGYESASQEVGRVFVVEGFGGFERIPNDFFAAMAPGRDAEVSCRGIELLSKWKDSVWGTGKFSTTVHVCVSRVPSFSSLPRSRDVSLIDFSSATLSPAKHTRAVSVDTPRASTLGRNPVSSPIFMPTLIPKQLNFKARCLFRFQAETMDELDMEVGDILDIDSTVERGTDGWWFGTGVRGVGWIPSNFVEKIP